jgi:predicted enzyme related to lactoylglutathione lyase
MPTLLRIAPEIPAIDLGESIRYYEEKLGFQLVMEIPSASYAIVERDGVAIHLFQIQQGQAQSPVGMHLFTDQIEDLFAEVTGRGAQISQAIVRKPWGNRDFRLLDPAGNELKFTEPIDGE